MFIIIYVIHHLCIINLIDWNTSLILLHCDRSYRVASFVRSVAYRSNYYWPPLPLPGYNGFDTFGTEHWSWLPISIDSPRLGTVVHWATPRGEHSRIDRNTHLLHTRRMLLYLRDRHLFHFRKVFAIVDIENL